MSSIVPVAYISLSTSMVVGTIIIPILAMGDGSVGKLNNLPSVKR